MQEPVRTVEELFFAALGLEGSEARRNFLDRHCGDPALRRRVEELLAGDAHGGHFLEAPALTVGATHAYEARPDAEESGAGIGPYRLLEPLGEGGMGVVYVAEQVEPVRRRVALKVIKPGMDSKQVVARFEAERQALALMDHPSIAKVHDAGMTPSGRPYFVMELVRGLPLTEYCDHEQLSIGERLDLFVLVCRAVQHAHQKGVIHRDLKPSNVLVTVIDGIAVPKVIDFGVAKATGQTLTEKTLYTGFQQFVGTPLYVSPEQAELSGVDVDTRSDIYSLGVLLYELLTGTTPLDPETLKTAAFDELRRIIREEEPPRPSTRLGSLTTTLQSVSASRRADPRRLNRAVRGELDWIVMKALEKDRNRRYETAGDLALDVERYLANEPVQACPPSAGYRLRKFARRNRRALATVAFVAFVLLAALAAVAGTLGWALRDRSAREEAIAQAASIALQEAERLLAERHYAQALSSALRAKGLLAAGGREDRLPRVWELCGDLRMVLRLEEIRLPHAVGGVEGAYNDVFADVAYADAFREFGIDALVLEPAEAARRVRARRVRLELTVALDQWARKRKTSRAADDLSWKRLVAVARAADDDAWRNQVRDAIAQGKDEVLVELAASPRIGSLPLQTLSLLGGTIQDARVAAAVLQQAQRQYPDDFWISFQLAWSLEHMKLPRVDEAIRYYTAARAIRPRNAPVHVFLGNLLRRRGDLDDAMAEYRRSLDLQPDYATARHNLAFALWQAGRREEALAEQREAVRLNPDNPSLVRGLNWLKQAIGRTSCHEGRRAP